MYMHAVRVALCAVATTLLVAGTPTARAGGAVRIGGTGMGLEVARLLVAAMNDGGAGITGSIMPSLGSTGGIEALIDGALDIALSARPLKPAEIAKGAHDAACVRPPFVLASSLTTAIGVKRAEVAALFAD